MSTSASISIYVHSYVLQSTENVINSLMNLKIMIVFAMLYRFDINTFGMFLMRNM